MDVACLEFRGENFRGWRKNHEIRESFLPRKFPTIRYLGGLRFLFNDIHDNFNEIHYFFPCHPGQHL